MADTSIPQGAPLRAPTHPRTWPGWLGVGLLWLLARIPWPLQRAIGRGLGHVLIRAARSRRRAARRNLALCLPELDEAARESLLLEHFQALGIGAFEFMRAWWGSIAPLERGVRIEGVEAIRELVDSGRGVLLVSGHFTTLEVCGRMLCRHLPVAGLYRRHDGQVMEWAVRAGRLRYAHAMFRQEEVRATVKHLRAGGVLWYAPDQDMRGKDTVFAPFFGIPASTITATHQLARMTGCAVVPFFHRREGGRYVLRLGAPLEDFPSADPVEDSRRVNAAIEAMVREAPSQYLWIHRRFKRRPPGEPPIY